MCQIRKKDKFPSVLTDPSLMKPSDSSCLLLRLQGSHSLNRPKRWPQLIETHLIIYFLEIKSISYHPFRIYLAPQRRSLSSIKKKEDEKWLFFYFSVTHVFLYWSLDSMGHKNELAIERRREKRDHPRPWWCASAGSAGRDWNWADSCRSSARTDRRAGSSARRFAGPRRRSPRRWCRSVPPSRSPGHLKYRPTKTTKA